MRWIAVALLLACALPSQSARAQPADPPLDPIVEVTIDPPRVVVGQPAMLQIVVLAPNYMTSPPELPDFQVRNAVTRPLQSVNISETRNGASYAGVRFQFAISPQEAGSYAISQQSISVKYAATPPATRQMSIALPRVAFETYIPNAAASLRPFLSGSKLTAEQTIDRSSDQLKAGDAVRRTVTIRAEGTLAMFLPPQAFTAVDGLKVYPAQPALDDKAEGRSDLLISTRVDSATYMLERPGEYSLPAIDIGWWNVGAGKIERIHLDAVALKVAANPAVEAGAQPSSWSPDELIDIISVHWRLAVLMLAGIAALAWVAPSAVRRIAGDLRCRRIAYLNSEAWSFRQLRQAARHRSPDTIYFALLGWLQRFEPLGSERTVDALTSAAGDQDLDQQIDALRRELFGAGRQARGWSPRRLMRHVGSARRTLRRRSRRTDNVPALPRQINPHGPDNRPVGKRRVAR
jgi:hypothetical protein